MFLDFARDLKIQELGANNCFQELALPIFYRWIPVGSSIIFFTETHKVHIQVCIGIECDLEILNVVKLRYCF